MDGQHRAHGKPELSEATDARPASAPHRRFFPVDTGETAYWPLGFIALVAAAQIVFLTVRCDWELAGDEAEYWAWSRKLDWSYFTRGPLIALVIRASTEIVGSLSLALSGSLMPAVRLPAVVLGALTAWGIYRLTRETTQNGRAALFAVFVLPAIPLFRVGALIITCDTPLIACWVWAAVWCHRAILRNDTRAWIVAGVIAGIGVTAKYTMLALPASVGLFLLLVPTRRGQLLKPGFWLMSTLCMLGMAPIIAWNATHGWVGADQMAHRLGLLPSDMVVQPPTTASVDRPSPLVSLLTFLASEPAVLGVWWVVGLAAIVRALTVLVLSWRGRPTTAQSGAGDHSETVQDAATDHALGLLYVFSLWLVVWLACVVVSLLGENEANWAAPAHAALACLMGWWISAAWAQAILRRVLAATWILSMVLLTAVQHTEWFYPWLAKSIPPPTSARLVPLREFDPTCRMRGSAELAAKVDVQMAALKGQGLDPFILAPTYTLASSLSFYLPGQPEVYCLSWSPGMPPRAVNQHDLWRPNPRFDLDAFRGRPAIIVSETQPTVRYARAMVSGGVFRHAFPTERIPVHRSGLLVALWDMTICADYQGLAWARRGAGTPRR